MVDKKRKILVRGDFEEILKNYSIGSYIQHKKLWWSLDNSLYKLKTSRGNYLIKIYEDTDLQSLYWVLKNVEHLQGKGIPIPTIYKTKNKKLIFEAHKPLIIQKFVDGSKVEKIDEEFIKSFAKNLGKINKNLLKLKKGGDYVWVKIGRQFEPFHFRSGKIIEGFYFDRAEERILEEFKKNVKKDRLRTGIIHGDYQKNNSVIKDKKIVAIIDWDDMREDYLAEEVAIAITHLLIKPGFKTSNVSLFCREYEKYIKLNFEEKKALYYLIKQRKLGEIVWSNHQRKIHKEKSKIFTRWIKESIEGFNEFDKISLEDFLRAVT